MPVPSVLRSGLSQSTPLAGQPMREEGVDFQQCSNAFRKCAAPQRLQELANSLTAEDLLNCGQKWLARFTPFFTERERKQAGVSAPLVLLSDRVLRQPDLSPARRARQAG